MFGTFPVGNLHFRVIPARFGDACFEVIYHHPLRNAAQKSKRIPMQSQPGRYLLVENKFDILVTTPGKGHHESPGFADFARFRVYHPTGIPEIYLSFFPWCRFHPDRHIRLDGFQLPYKTVNGHVTAVEAPFFQPCFDGADLHPLLAQLNHLFPVRFHC